MEVLYSNLDRDTDYSENIQIFPQFLLSHAGTVSHSPLPSSSFSTGIRYSNSSLTLDVLLLQVSTTETLKSFYVV